MFKPELRHFLFNPYREGFWSLNYSPLTPGCLVLSYSTGQQHELKATGDKHNNPKLTLLFHMPIDSTETSDTACISNRLGVSHGSGLRDLSDKISAIVRHGLVLTACEWWQTHTHTQFCALSLSLKTVYSQISATFSFFVGMGQNLRCPFALGWYKNSCGDKPYLVTMDMVVKLLHLGHACTVSQENSW